MSASRTLKTRTMRAALASVAALFALYGPPLAFGQEERFAYWDYPVQEYRLKNGLRVILSEDDSLPLVTVAIAYRAGTVRERQGQEGLAYLMETLMFQGSENVGPLQHVGYIQKVGGELNATTTFDKSLFYQTLPSNQLALALWLESDRMRSALISAAAVERQRSTLLEEHLSRLAGEPYLESFSIFDTLLYPDLQYGRPLIGNGEEMKRLTGADVSAFYRAFYVPNNAVLCIVGNIQAVRAKELVARYFETIPPGPDPPALPSPRFEQQGEVSVFHPDIPAPTAGFHLGYRIYPLQTGDVYALKILEYLLMKGKTSRLWSRLIDKDRTAYHLSGGLEERGAAMGLKIFCLTNNAVMADRSHRGILSEIDRIRSGSVSESDLEKAKRFFRADYARRLATRQDRALMLIEAAFSGRSLASLPEELSLHLRVNATRLSALVARHFVPRNKVFMRLGPR
jgi:predicted Zn-dependent peptidase